MIAAKGAPEAIADLCHFDAERLATLTRPGRSGDGERPAGPRRRPGALQPEPRACRPSSTTSTSSTSGSPGCTIPSGPAWPTAVAECARAGVRTVMITGDYPGTALAIAREIGLDHAEGCITGPELDAMTDEELAHRIGSVSVFARMVPEQKLQLIRALKANGEVVGMTGDGVNDAPALRAADIGIAMGARGTDVARESAALVITDDDFTSIVGGVRQGRGIFDNLRKAMSYIIAVHVPIAGMSLIPVFVADWPLVLLPVQIAFLELIIDPACSVVFEAEQVDPKIMEHPPRGLGEPMFGRRVLTIAFAPGRVGARGGLRRVPVGHRARTAPTTWSGRSPSRRSCVGNLALILVNRSWRLSIWRVRSWSGGTARCTGSSARRSRSSSCCSRCRPCATPSTSVPSTGPTRSSSSPRVSSA